MRQLIKVLAFLASIAFLLSTAHAQTFKAVPLDCGGWFSGFAQADNGRLYGYGDVFGAWRSDDSGSNWSYLNWSIQGGEVYGTGMAVQKNNADVVYYATGNSLLKSTNGGTTWIALLTDVGDNTPRFRGSSPILIRSNDPNEIWFAGPRKGMTGWLWRSSNGGTDWTSAGGTTFNTNRVQTLHNVAAFANQIWVGTDNGLYVSTDGGNNFSLVGGTDRLSDVGMIQRFTSGTFAGVGLVTRSNNNGGGISRITAADYNDAATYSVTDAATSDLYFGYPTGLQIFSDGSSGAWNTAGDRHGFSPAGDGGRTFTLRGTTLKTGVVPIWTSAAVMAAQNKPNYGTDQVIEAVGNPNKWMITGGLAPMYSLDKGLSWQYFPNGSGLAGVKTYSANVSRYDANRIYIPASDIGSAIVTDGGASGQANLSSSKAFDFLHNAHRIMEGPNTRNLVLAGVDQSNNANAVVKSSDGGTNWNIFNLTGSGLPACIGGITKSVMSITDANDFMVVLSEDGGPAQRVYRTTNGGSNFTNVAGLPDFSPTGSRYHPEVCFLERDATKANVRYFVARDQGFYKSTNSGANWSLAAHPYNGGAWVWGLVADPIRSNNLWAAGDWAGVRFSRDGGQTWTETTKYFNARYVSSCDGKIAIFGKADGDDEPRLYYSNDDGVTWYAQTDSSNNFHMLGGLSVDRNGKIWVSWNSATVVTPVTGTSDTQAPTVPTNLTSSNVTSSSLTLNWTASTDDIGVTDYEVFRGGTSQGTVTGTTYNVTGLTASTAYSVTVRARDAAGNFSAQSAALSVTTAATITVPTVSTTAVSSVTSTSANSGGHITLDGGANIMARGVAWSTTTDPTVALSTKTTDGSGNGIFSSSITGLAAGTTYHVRAYATNSAGTSYGSTVTFTAATSKNKIKVYPNPATEYVTVDFTEELKNKGGKFEIFDLLGRKVYDSNTVVTGTSLEINVSKLVKGIYIIKVIKGAESVAKQLIIR